MSGACHPLRVVPSVPALAGRVPRLAAGAVLAASVLLAGVEAGRTAFVGSARDVVTATAVLGDGRFVVRLTLPDRASA